MLSGPGDPQDRQTARQHGNQDQRIDLDAADAPCAPRPLFLHHRDAAMDAAAKDARAVGMGAAAIAMMAADKQW